MLDVLLLGRGAGAMCSVPALTWLLLVSGSTKKHPESARHQRGTPGMSVRLVMGFYVLYLHKSTILPGGFNAGKIIDKSLSPVLRTAALLW